LRKNFAQTVSKELSNNPSSVLLLGDIGVHAFRDSLKEFPDRVYNIGILEQSMISVGAGMSLEGLIPTIHTIAPFIVERALEQLKVDFGYQKLQGNVVTVGASIDYAALGGTHHCPGDVSILLNIPDLQILVPGHGEEFASLYTETSRNGELTYTRLSETCNSAPKKVQFGKGLLIQEGHEVTVLCVGPTLDLALEACADLNVNILYFTTVSPFDSELLKSTCTNGKVLLIEPFYKHTLSPLIIEALSPLSVQIKSIGIPRKFLRNYGTTAQHLNYIGLTVNNIKSTITELIGA